jgi:hypothetical protein
LRQNQEKVRSTTQRRGSTTKPHVVGSLDDLDPQAGLARHGLVDLARVAACIAPHEVEPVEALTDLVEHARGAVTILDAGRVDNDPQGRAFHIDLGVPFAALRRLCHRAAHSA